MFQLLMAIKQTVRVNHTIQMSGRWGPPLAWIALSVDVWSLCILFATTVVTVCLTIVVIDIVFDIKNVFILGLSLWCFLLWVMMNNKLVLDWEYQSLPSPHVLYCHTIKSKNYLFIWIVFNFWRLRKSSFHFWGENSPKRKW